MEGKLKVQALKRYSPPRYPVQERVLENPALLRMVPRRWRAKPAVCAALLFTIAGGLCGCGSQTEPGNSSYQVSSGESSHKPVSSSPVSAASENNREADPLQVPLFEHGDGRGSYGCMSVAPPVFLSEEEAAQVIREEALAQGVDFSKAHALQGSFPATEIYSISDTPIEDTWEGDLELDGYDETLGVGFEFVSQQDVSDWQRKTDIYISVETYDMKGTAQRLSQAVENTAVFYDPGVSDYDEILEYEGENTEGAYEEFVARYEEEQKEKLRDQLREQVRDFLAWLAGQGVI